MCGLEGKAVPKAPEVFLNKRTEKRKTHAHGNSSSASFLSSPLGQSVVQSSWRPRNLNPTAMEKGIRFSPDPLRGLLSGPSANRWRFVPFRSGRNSVSELWHLVLHHLALDHVSIGLGRPRAAEVPAAFNFWSQLCSSSYTQTLVPTLVFRSCREPTPTSHFQ